MKKLSLLAFVFMQMISAGCVSKPIPDVNDMQKLDSDEIKSLLPGNTLTYTAVWGRWVEYYRDDNSGFAGTWADLLDLYGWEVDEAEADISFEFTDKAEICRRYSGDPEWANPELRYCSAIYVYNGTYYIIDTINPYNPNFVGVPNALEIKKGDYYDLSNGPGNHEIHGGK